MTLEVDGILPADAKLVRTELRGNVIRAVVESASFVGGETLLPTVEHWQVE